MHFKEKQIKLQIIKLLGSYLELRQPINENRVFVNQSASKEGTTDGQSRQLHSEST